MSVTQSAFGKLADGTAVDRYALRNANGITATVISYGGILTGLETPDRKGTLADITLGFNDLSGYLGDHPYFGANVGRFANRIGDARFTLDGTEYRLAANDGPNHLHGGIKGFDKVVWDGTPFERDGECGVVFTYLSPDGEENYPGNLTVTLTYTLTDADELKLQFEATTDKATPVNLTHHTYFNLKGEGNGDVLGHKLQLFAKHYTPVNAQLIPTGEVAPVAGTPMDFTTPHAIGERMAKVAGGYDHNFVLTSGGGTLAPAARVVEPETGRVMEVHTTEPATQFYGGNFLDGTLTGKSGKTYGKHFGFCLEPQKYPDSPNQPAFPNCILRPGETYTHSIVLKFSAE